MTWLTGNLPTVIVLAILICIVVLAIRSIRNDKKKGKSSCGGSCSHCALGGSCRNGKE